MTQVHYRQAGEAAPPLEVVDPQTGAAKTLRDLLGEEPVLLYWIKPDCPTCKLAIPFVERLASRVPKDRLAVIAQAEPAEIAPFRAEFGLDTVPIYCEPEPFADADAWGLTHVPTWFLVAPDGSVQEAGAMFSQPDLERSLGVLGGSGALFTAEEREELPETRPG